MLNLSSFFRGGKSPMKKIFTICLFLLLATSSVVFAQSHSILGQVSETYQYLTQDATTYVLAPSTGGATQFSIQKREDRLFIYIINISTYPAYFSPVNYGATQIGNESIRTRGFYLEGKGTGTTTENDNTLILYNYIGALYFISGDKVTSGLTNDVRAFEAWK